MDLDADEAALLRGARRALSPSPEDTVRIRQATHLALASLPAALQSGADASSPVVDAALARLSQWGGKLVVASALVSASAGAGYTLGLRAGRAEVPPTSAPAAPAPASEDPRSAELRPTPELPVSPSLHAPVERPGAAPPERRASGLADASPAGLDDAPLAREIRALRRVDRLLRENNPRFALALLSELDRDVPKGQLTEERRAAFAAATCAVFPDTAKAARRGFEERFPRSVYQGRVDQACASADEGPARGRDEP